MQAPTHFPVNARIAEFEWLLIKNLCNGVIMAHLWKSACGKKHSGDNKEGK